MCALIARRRAIETRERTAALVTIAHEVIARYRAEKTRRGLLDYDDLIDKALHLLAEPRAQWVHYKLDLGIDHVLIDEAQDTSDRQWQIVQRLTAEFTTGQGARESQPLGVRGRRREAIDLFVPGRGAGSVRQNEAPLRDRVRAGRDALRGSDISIFVPLGAGRAAGGRYGVRPGAGLRGADRGAGRDRA